MSGRGWQFGLIGLTALALSACAPRGAAPASASVPLKPGEVYTLETRGVQIAKGTRFTLTVGDQVERRSTGGREWYFVTARASGAAKAASFNYYPDRDRLSVVITLDAAVGTTNNQPTASRLEVIYCDLGRGQDASRWEGSLNYDPGLQTRTLRDGSCWLQRPQG